MILFEAPRALRAFKDLEKNGSANGWPQRIWKVVGGGSEGVPVSKERGGKIEKERLSQGALVEELELKQELMLDKHLDNK